MEQSPTLRPLGIMQIIDRIFRLCRANFWLFVGISAAVSVPFNLLYQASNLPQYLTHIINRVTLPNAPAVALPHPAVLVLLGLLTLIASPLSAAALTLAISERYLGRPARVGDSYLRMLRRFPSFALTLFIVYALYGLIMALPALPLAAVFVPFLLHPSSEPPFAVMVITGLICVPLMLLLSLILAAWLPFCTNAFVLEEKRYFAAVSRAVFLLRPWYWAQVLLVLIIMGFITATISGALTVPVTIIFSLKDPNAMMVQPLALRIILGLITGLVNSVTIPLTMGVVILQYYDARIRKEGFDLALLAQGLAASVPTPETPAPPAIEQPAPEPQPSPEAPPEDPAPYE